MHFKKLQAGQLFDGHRFYDNGEVLILKPDGAVEAIVQVYDAGADIEKIPGILAPGFINCHCHLELSHLRGAISENTGLAGFVGQVVQKRAAAEAVILSAIAEAETEMQENGIVAVGDICNTTYTLPQKSRGNLYYHNFIEAMGFDPALADKNFSLYEGIYTQFARVLPRNQVSITPHAPYSVSAPLWKNILGHINQKELFSIHNQETIDETHWFRQKQGGFVAMFQAMGLNTDSFLPSGKSSLQTYLPKFSKGQQVVLVHNVHTTAEDIVFAESAPPDIYWCLCPNANQYISGSIPDPGLWLNGGTIVLGTDSLASNHQLSIWEEISTIRKYYPQRPLAEMLQWATLNGARALKMENTLGSFEKGKKPGFVHINNNMAQRFIPT